MAKKAPIYELQIANLIVIGTRAKLERIQRAFIGVETTERRFPFKYDHPGFDARENRSVLVLTSDLEIRLKRLKNSPMTEDEFDQLRKESEDEYERRQRDVRPGLPAPREGLPAPRLELPAPRN